MPVIFNSTEEENLFMKQFSKKHHFPKREECLNILITKINHPNDDLIQDMVSYFNFDLLQNMYNYNFDTNFLSSLGSTLSKNKAIYNLYGLSKIIGHLINKSENKYNYTEQVVLINNIKTRCEGLWNID